MVARVLQTGPRPFERAGHRLDSRFEHVGHLAGVETEDVAQDEHGELARRQHLQSGHERKRDGFGLFVAGLGTERHTERVLEQHVGKRLEPRDLAEPGRLGRFDTDNVPRLRGTAACRTQRVETLIRRDPVEPRADGRAARVSIETLPRGQQRALQRVLRVLQRAEHPVAVHLQLAAMRFGQRAERVVVAGSRPCDEFVRHQFHFPVTSSVTFGCSSSRVHLVWTPTDNANWAVSARPFSRRPGVDTGGSGRAPTQEKRKWERS